MINTAIMLIALWSLYRLYLQSSSEMLIALAHWTLFGGMLVSNLIILFKAKALWKFMRAMLYVVALLQALNLMIIAKDFLTLSGFLAMVYTLMVVIYLIGFRGYLNSHTFFEWFMGAYIKKEQD
ncbi:hypothetical protein CW740_08065 [Kangiella profundi]|uniref:Uncharacterized protein n=2 Tax=Kangiella profundi TaxID=1561924 RepID=A0A2K9A8E1_9GAMM|nr:hypothetical protein CW740_08065 [Kangiella profundi]